MLRALARIVSNGHVVRGAKPVYWCFDCASALAEAEIEYGDKVSPAVDVAYDAVDAKALAAKFGVDAGDADRRHADLDHHAVDAAGEPGGVARRRARIRADRRPCARRQARAAGDRQRAGRQGARSATASSRRPCLVMPTARRMERLKLQHPFYPREVPVILGDHVSAEDGTGAVHTSPDHGVEDFVVAREYGIDLLNYIESRGTYRADTPAADGLELGGMHIWKANDAIVELLRRARRAAGVREDRAQLPALLAPQDAGDLPHHAAVVHLDGAGEAARDRADLDQDRALGAGLGRGAHRRHGRRPPGLVHLAPAHLGRADRAVRAQGHAGAASAFRRAAGAGRAESGAGRHRCVVHAGCGRAARRRRERLRESHRRAGRLVRFRRHPFRGGRPAPRTAAGHGVALQGDVPGRLRPASRLVPVVAC